jgi:hypothetical protein
VKRSTKSRRGLEWSEERKWSYFEGIRREYRNISSAWDDQRNGPPVQGHRRMLRQVLADAMPLERSGERRWSARRR